MSNKPRKKKKKQHVPPSPILAALDAIAEESGQKREKSAKKKPIAKKESAAKKEPATELMKLVAKSAPVMSKIKKAFSESEIAEILEGNEDLAAKKAEQESRAEFKKEQKRIKRMVLDMEATNRDKLIFYKSSENGEFYKALDTSALYYSQRLATLMGRKSNVMIDTDRFSKAMYVASVANMEKFVEQFKKLEGGEPEITIDGVYIFPLKKPISDEDLTMLKQTENTRRERMHNILKPKQIAPAVYQQILMVVRQLGPKADKLENEGAKSYQVFGGDMLVALRDILVIYDSFARGIYDAKTAADLILTETAKIRAVLTILGETRKMGALPLASLGEKVNTLEQLVNKDLKGEG